MKPAVPPEPAPPTLDPATLVACEIACEEERRENEDVPGEFRRGFDEGCLSCRDRIRHLAAPPTVAPAREAAEAYLASVALNCCAKLRTTGDHDVRCDMLTKVIAERDRASRSPGPLTFEAFSAINKARCEAASGFGREVGPDTVVAFALGVAEEAGEVVGAYRAFAGISKRKGGITREHIGEEIADVIAYCDLLAQALGLDVADIVMRKFDKTSERIGYPPALQGQEGPSSAREGKVHGAPLSGLDAATVEACGRAALASACLKPCEHGECHGAREASAAIRALADTPQLLTHEGSYRHGTPCALAAPPGQAK